MTELLSAEPFVVPGGGVGKDIKIWRDLSRNADDAKLDEDIRKSLVHSARKLLLTLSTVSKYIISHRHAQYR